MDAIAPQIDHDTENIVNFYQQCCHSITGQTLIIIRQSLIPDINFVCMLHSHIITKLYRYTFQQRFLPSQYSCAETRTVLHNYSTIATTLDTSNVCCNQQLFSHYYLHPRVSGDLAPQCLHSTTVQHSNKTAREKPQH